MWATFEPWMPRCSQTKNVRLGRRWKQRSYWSRKRWRTTIGTGALGVIGLCFARPCRPLREGWRFSLFSAGVLGGMACFELEGDCSMPWQRAAPAAVCCSLLGGPRSGLQPACALGAGPAASVPGAAGRTDPAAGALGVGLYTLFFRFYILFRSDFQRFSAGI